MLIDGLLCGAIAACILTGLCQLLSKPIAYLMYRCLRCNDPHLRLRLWYRLDAGFDLAAACCGFVVCAVLGYAILFKEVVGYLGPRRELVLAAIFFSYTAFMYVSARWGLARLAYFSERWEGSKRKQTRFEIEIERMEFEESIRAGEGEEWKFPPEERL